MSDQKNVSFFLRSNAEKKREVIPYAPSKRFKDEKGEPVNFILRLLSGTELSKLQNDAVVIDEGTADFDSEDFLATLMVKCVVYPNLKDAELQDSYQVMNEKELLNAMLEGGEYQRLAKKCQEINGLRENINELKVKAKN
ncbi:phage tail assembly chaperone [Aedoeadaptatus coxii]|uniref:phage tail assembly chaperone n=1 Tax=Aedoeadaptatus coxii TaxID=755172 RepID=UPI002AD4827B|nr:hypothetical protein [Peptoniphilus coxii]